METRKIEYYWLFILSAVIHLTFAGVLYLTSSNISKRSLRSRREDLPVVELLEKPEPARRPEQLPKNKQTLIRGFDLPKDLLSNKKNKRRFASDRERDVLEEVRAANTGFTQNQTTNTKSTNQGQKSTVQKRQSPPLAHLDLRPNLDSKTRKNNKTKSVDSHLGDLLIDPQQDQPNQQQEGDVTINNPFAQVSSIGEVLPEDIKIGNFTSLNTDRHLYYTFYARIEEQIRSRWEQNAKAVLYNSRNPNPTGSTFWYTRIEVLLDSSGNFIKAILHEASGNNGLDSAPVQAFRDAKRFPNPPLEMLHDDGKIHIHYSFRVETASARRF